MTAAALGSVAVSDAGEYADLAAALCLVVAAFCLLGWLVGVAAVADLLSRPVLVGYMAGVAVIMISSQFGKLTGSRPTPSGSGRR